MYCMYICIIYMCMCVYLCIIKHDWICLISFREDTDFSHPRVSNGNFITCFKLRELHLLTMHT